MKKIGLLIAAAALFGLAAQASPSFKIGKYEATGLKPEFTKMLDASKVIKSDISTLDLQNGEMTRSWIDETTGSEYSCKLNPSGYLVDAFNWKGEPPTFEELPLYIATLIIYERKTNPATGAQYQNSGSIAMMAWPSYYFWSNADGYFINWEEGAIKYDEMDIVTLEDMCNFEGMGKSFQSLCDYIIYGNVTDINPSTGEQNPDAFYGIKDYSIIDGIYVDMSGSTQVQYGISETSICKFTPISYKNGIAPSCKYQFIGSFSGNAGNISTNVNYDGTGNYFGWVPMNQELEFKNPPHIFYEGNVSDERNSRNQLMYDESYELTKFWAYIPVGNLEVVVGANATTFDPTNSSWREVEGDPNSGKGIGFAFGVDTPQEQISGDYWNWFKGPVYVANDTPALKPASICNLTWPTFYEDPMYGELPYYVPENCCLVPYGIYNSLFDENAFFFCYQETAFQLTQPTQLGLCTPDGVYLKGNDEYGDKWTSKNFTGNCILHPDPTNVGVTVEYPAVQDKEEVQDGIKGLTSLVKDGACVVVSRGEIAISSVNAAKAYVYDFSGKVVAVKNVKAGECVRVAADKGSYIVKVGNLAQKVVL